MQLRLCQIMYIKWRLKDLQHALGGVMVEREWVYGCVLGVCRNRGVLKWEWEIGSNIFFPPNERYDYTLFTLSLSLLRSFCLFLSLSNLPFATKQDLG